MEDKIKTIFNDSIKLKQTVSKKYAKTIVQIAKAIVDSLKKDGKMLLFGNGGSAADSQHIAAEFIGRFNLERQALPAIALTTNTSILTSVANDYGYEEIFARQIEGLAKPADIAIGISTSGNARNVITGILQAKRMGMVTVALTGCDGGELAKITDIALIVPSYSTPRIQEVHITIGHILCQLVEEKIFKKRGS